MASTRNEHVFPREKGWIVRREGSKKTSRLFGYRKDAMEYAGILASNDGGFVISHKYNGQFKEFKNGNRIYVRKHSIAPLLSGTTEIMHPIINNVWPIIETRNNV